MAEPLPPQVVCQICQAPKARGEVMPAELVRPLVVATIRKTHPDWSPAGFICLPDLNRFRIKHVEEILETEKGELSALEAEVVKGMREQEIIARNVNVEFERELSLGERVADRVAAFGGSWSFIIFFGVVILIWIAINSYVLLRRPFDPYPYIFLNLVLSSIAAFQAPFIMMSQNRQETRDRLRSENDYKVNLQAELEIRQLNAKLDQLLTHQWQRLLEIQQIQAELMQGLFSKEPR
jgi:uncharacterized membrane protein